MITGLWERWIPKENLLDTYNISTVVDSIDSLKIIMINEDSNKQVIILFKDSVWAYRSIEEGLWLKRDSDLKFKYGVDFLYKCPFFKVKDSSYLKFISEESYGALDSFSIQHFVIVCMNSVFEIINEQDPEIEIINLKDSDGRRKE